MKNFRKDKFITDDTELDLNSQLSITEIMRLLQLVTYNHSDEITLDHDTMITRDNAFWVVTKMKISILSPILSHEKLTLKTWTKQPGAVRFVRDLSIKCKNKIKVKGTSEWCCLDYTTRTLRKSNTIDYPQLEMIETKDNNLSFSNIKCDVDENDYVYTRTIRATDIDMNNHTNNLKYNFMALDAFNTQELKDKCIKEYEIYFVNESHENDQIKIYKRKIKNQYYIEGKIENKTIFRSVIRFFK